MTHYNHVAGEDVRAARCHQGGRELVSPPLPVVQEQNRAVEWEEEEVEDTVDSEEAGAGVLQHG